MDGVLDEKDKSKKSMHFYSKGIDYFATEQYKIAVRYFNKSLTYNPNNRYALQYKGESLNELKKFEESLKCFEKLLKKEPKNDHNLVNKGKSLQGLGRYEEALDYFGRADAISKSVTIFYDKAELFYDIGRYKEALELFDLSLEHFPDDVDVKKGRKKTIKKIKGLKAQRYEDAGNLKKALELYEKAEFWDDAKRCRKKLEGKELKGLKAKQTKIEIGNLGTLGTSISTEIHDSVLNKSNIVDNKIDGIEVFNNCPYCGKKFNLKKTPRYCPYCNEELG